MPSLKIQRAAVLHQELLAGARVLVRFMDSLSRHSRVRGNDEARDFVLFDYQVLSLVKWTWFSTNGRAIERAASI